MKAIDLYRDTLRELDKFESPVFTIGDFNYFGNKGISEWIATNYERFDIIQKEVDDMNSMITLGQALTVSGGTVSLPSDYRHMLHLKLRVKFLKDAGRYKKDQIVEVFPERMKSSQKGFRYKNAFARPNFKRYYYELANGTLRILFDNTVVQLVNDATPNLYIDFVKQPTDVFLNPDKASDYNNPANNTVLVFNTGASRNYVYYEIVNVIRKVFLENIESGRMQEATRQAVVQQ